jgi:hypothetical protein
MSLPPESIVAIVALVVATPPTAWALYQFHLRRERRRQSMHAIVQHQDGAELLGTLPIYNSDGYHLATLSIRLNTASNS